jgi:dTMP kinase
MLITFEGIDGSGKTTQISKLVQFLNNFFPEREVVVTCEPGGTALGKRLRQEILHGEHIGHHTELLLYAADRAEHIERIIKPALNRNAVVISDRFTDSTVAYQVAGRHLSEEFVNSLNSFSADGIVPDLTILLDIEAHDSRHRVELSGEKKDRLESAKVDFFERTREKFLELAENDRYEDSGRWVVIDATAEIDAIAEQVAQAVNKLIEDNS